VNLREEAAEAGDLESGFPVAAVDRSKNNLPLFVSSVLLTIAAAGAIVFAFYIVFVSYSPTPVADIWASLVNLADSKKSWYSPRSLWALHNEHRVPLLQMALMADIAWFGGYFRLLLALTLFLMTAQLVMWAAFLRTIRGLPMALWLSLISCFAFCIFSPAQYENLITPFQCDFVGAFAFASASFVLLVWLDQVNRKWLAVSLAAALAFLSECCLASGLLVWPILVAASLLLKFRKGQRIFLSAVGFLAIAIYLKNYHQPAWHSSPMQSLQSPGAVANYVLVYFGHELATYCTFPKVATIVLTATGVSALIALLRNEVTRAVSYTLLMTVLFLLGTGIITALGRLFLGPDQAMSSRYQTAAMLFWACLFTAMFLGAWKFRGRRDLIRLNVIALGLMLLPISGMRPFLDTLKQRKAVLNELGESLDEGVIDPAVQTPVALGNSPLFAAVLGSNFLHSIGRTTSPSHSLRVAPSLFEAAGQRKDLCAGAFDRAVRVQVQGPGASKVRVDGWILTSQTHQPVPFVAVTDQTGALLAASDNHFFRPDVMEAIPDTRDGFVGWSFYVPLHADSRELTVLALVNGHACPLETKTIPAQ
jgi:hypothetical protein